MRKALPMMSFCSLVFAYAFSKSIVKWFSFSFIVDSKGFLYFIEKNLFWKVIFMWLGVHIKHNKSLKTVKSGALKHCIITILLLARWRNNSVVYFSDGMKIHIFKEVSWILVGDWIICINLKLVHELWLWLHYSHLQKRE